MSSITTNGQERTKTTTTTMIVRARAGGIKDEGNKSRNDTFAISNQTVYVRTTKRQKGDYQKVIKIIAVK